MRGQLFIEGPDAGRRLSRFWMLLALAAVIATAGVVADSTATVIGAMIVAPLMTPILGVVLAVVLGDRANLARSIALVLLGVGAVVFISWLIGHVIELPVVEATNSQVAGRVHPRLIDLLAALATGAVGAFALMRSDISDTLPGVAIAISLVPPLAVVGLTLEAGETHQASGAVLLFATNVAAILTTGVIVMFVYGVHKIGARTKQFRRRNALLVVAAFAVVVMVPLILSTRVISSESGREHRVTVAAHAWVAGTHWEIVNVSTDSDGIVVKAIGPGDPPSPKKLRLALDRQGLRATDVRLDLIPQIEVELPGH